MSDKPSGQIPQGYWNIAIVVAAVLAVAMVVVVLIAAGVFFGILKW